MIKKLLKKCIKKEFVKFFFVGGTSSFVDWGMFYLLSIILTFHYQVSLVIAFLCSLIVHYSLNRKFTFKSKSKRLILQISLFLLVVIIYLVLSMSLMFVCVEIILLHKMISKILITFLLFFVSFTLHKYLTFNKKWFKEVLPIKKPFNKSY